MLKINVTLLKQFINDRDSFKIEEQKRLVLDSKIVMDDDEDESMSSPIQQPCVDDESTFHNWNNVVDLLANITDSHPPVTQNIQHILTYVHKNVFHFTIINEHAIGV